MLRRLVTLVTAITFATIAALPAAAQATGSSGQGAETLEQAYGRMCGKGEKTETCEVLRQAMLAKLSGQGSGSAPASLPGASSKASPLPVTNAAPAPVATAQPAPESAVTTDLTGVWGFYAKLAGRRWLLEAPSGRTITDVSWLEPGRVLSVKSYAVGATRPLEAHYTIDAARRAVHTMNIGYAPSNIASRPNVAAIEQDGSWTIRIENAGINVVSQSFVVDDTTMRSVMRMSGSGITPTTTETVTKFARLSAADEAALVQTAQEKEMAKTLDKYLADQAALAIAERNAAAAARAPASAAPAKQKGGGGLLRAAIGAGVGLAAAQYAGADAEVTVGAMAKGAAVLNPDSPLAAVANATGDALITGTVAPSAGAGAMGAGGSGAGSYPTRPNILAGQPACSMMNEGNYRQVGVEGGNDVQLKTMCAQAYEYYFMYKRPISQGYAEADANRTYAAHEQSARVAIDFYSKNRGE